MDYNLPGGWQCPLADAISLTSDVLKTDFVGKRNRSLVSNWRVNKSVFTSDVLLSASVLE